MASVDQSYLSTLFYSWRLFDPGRRRVACFALTWDFDVGYLSIAFGHLAPQSPVSHISIGLVSLDETSHV